MPGALGRSPSWGFCKMAGSTVTSPTKGSIISFVMAPGRRIIGGVIETSTMVDSSPHSAAPPSRIMSIFPSRSKATWDALVGLGLPDALALGAAMGRPAARISAMATGCEGKRTATVSSPPVTESGTISVFGKIMVNGPGQKASISFCAAAGISRTMGRNSLIWEICRIKGLSEGRPFAR